MIKIKYFMEWISVKDKMPDTDKFGESDYILCYPKMGTPLVGWYSSKMGGFIVAHYKADSIVLNGHNAPTHWMLLPKPPNE